MRVNGTLVNYFVHCKRQWFLHYYRINLEDESELVKIGRALHEKNDDREVAVEGIKIDKITKDYIIEVKKSDADVEAAKYQLLYYLKVAREKGFEKRGKLECLEKNKKDKKIYIYEYEEHEEELNMLLEDMEKYYEVGICPPVDKKPHCKKCAYYNYCYI